MATQTGTLKAGNQLVIDSQGASVDYDVSVTGYAVDFKRIQQENTLSLGPHKVDCTYSVTVNSGSPSIYKVQPNGQREYTAATLPDPATLAPGTTVFVDGVVMQTTGVSLQTLIKEYLFRSVNTRVLSGTLTNPANGASGWTNAWTVAVEHKFSRARILVANANTGSSVTLGPFCAAATTAVTDLASARNNSATPVPILFSGATTVTIPACSASANPNYVWSDWVNVESLLRTDGMLHPWITIRGFIPIATTVYTAVGDHTQTWNSTLDGRGSYSMAQQGNLVSSNYSSFAGSQNFGTNILLGVQTSSETGCMQIGAFGDSIFATTDKGASGWVPKLTDALSGIFGIPVSSSNFGWNGQTTAQYYARWASQADNLKMSLAIFETYSTNNGASIAAVTEAKGFVAAFLDDCATKRILPVLWMPLVSSAWTFAQKQLIEDYRNEIRAYKNTPVIDCASILIDPVTLDYKPGVSDDGVHPNQTGLNMVYEHINASVTQALFGSRMI